MFILKARYGQCAQFCIIAIDYVYKLWTDDKYAHNVSIWMVPGTVRD